MHKRRFFPLSFSLEFQVISFNFQLYSFHDRLILFDSVAIHCYRLSLSHICMARLCLSSQCRCCCAIAWLIKDLIKCDFVKWKIYIKAHLSNDDLAGIPEILFMRFAFPPAHSFHRIRRIEFLWVKPNLIFSIGAHPCVQHIFFVIHTQM